MKLNLWYCLETIDYICLGTSESLLFEWNGIRHCKKYREKFYIITWIVDISLWLKCTALKSILRYWIYVSKKKERKKAHFERAPTKFKLMLKCNQELQLAECYICPVKRCGNSFNTLPESERRIWTMPSFGLSSIRCQAIIWTNYDVLPMEPLGTHYTKIWVDRLPSLLGTKQLSKPTMSSHATHPSTDFNEKISQLSISIDEIVVKLSSVICHHFPQRGDALISVFENQGPVSL